MPYIKVYIHFVWSTKNRIPYLDTKDKRFYLWNHIQENAKIKDIYIHCVNGYDNHCHCLVSLRHNQTIEQIMKLIKGESAHWINKEQMTDQKFEWQDEYFAASVSESFIQRTENYIKRQEAHHQKESCQEEYDRFLEKCGFQRFDDN